MQLQYSQNFPISGMQEADINLTLPPVAPATATVYGTVTDGTDPIPDATVKLFDSKGKPYQHTLTDKMANILWTVFPLAPTLWLPSRRGISSATPPA